MTRKRKASDDAPVPAATPPTDNKSAMMKKQKIDWAAVDNFEGFTISSVGFNTPKHGKRSKRNYGAYPGQDAPLDAEVVQPNPFQDMDLGEVHVKISPALYWESTNRYRKFTINNEEFSIGQLVFVKKVEDEQDAPDAIQHWLAKVLEIRAGDASHVYLRVFWAYRPEDLPGGRQPHHGSCELIISNHMDIIEALTVQASASVIYWNDDPDDLALPADQLFYRQSFDVTKKTRPLSKLNTFCVDKQPCNPDKLLVQCPHCSNWLHAECLEKEAVKTAPSPQNNTQKSSSKKRGQPSKATQANEEPFTAEVHSSDTGKTCLTITDNRQGQNMRQWDVDISCLMCGKIIEEADPSAATDHAIEAEDPDADDTKPTPPLEVASVLKDADADADADTTTPPTTTSTTKPPAPDAAPTPTETKVPRGRGRPPGSKNKKRKRSSYPFPLSGSAVKKKMKKKMAGSSAAGITSRGGNLEVEGEEGVKSEMGEEVDGPGVVVRDDVEDMVQDVAENMLQHDAHITVHNDAENMALNVPQQNATPAAAAAAIQDSIFQSGIRSVKRLLWRT